MKKILSLVTALLVIVSVFAFTSCGEKKDAGATATDILSDESSGKNTEPAVEFVSDVKSAKPGEEITVTLKLADCPYFACLTSEISYDKDTLAYVDYSAYKSDTYYDLFNDSGDGSVYYGYVATTENMDSVDLLTVKYQINEDAVPGTSTGITFTLQELGVGTDSSGDTVDELCQNYAPITLEIDIE